MPVPEPMPDRQPYRALDDGIELVVRVTPRGGRDAVDGLGHDDAGRAFLRVRVRVAPEDGAANRAVIGVLARLLGVPARQIRLAAGETARLKRFVIAGSPGALIRSLDTSLGKSGQSSGVPRET